MISRWPHHVAPRSRLILVSPRNRCVWLTNKGLIKGIVHPGTEIVHARHLATMETPVRLSYPHDHPRFFFSDDSRGVHQSVMKTTLSRDGVVIAARDQRGCSTCFLMFLPLQRQRAGCKKKEKKKSNFKCQKKMPGALSPGGYAGFCG